MSLILKINRYTPMCSVLEVIQWKSVNVRLEFLAMVFLSKIIRGLTPSYFHSFIIYNNEIHEHHTRSKK